jgi:hypothetical protein
VEKFSLTMFLLLLGSISLNSLEYLEMECGDLWDVNELKKCIKENFIFGQPNQSNCSHLFPLGTSQISLGAIFIDRPDLEGLTLIYPSTDRGDMESSIELCHRLRFLKTFCFMMIPEQLSQLLTYEVLLPFQHIETLAFGFIDIDLVGQFYQLLSQSLSDSYNPLLPRMRNLDILLDLHLEGNIRIHTAGTFEQMLLLRRVPTIFWS